MSPKVTIIAEAGVNHNGRRDLALQLVDVAAQAGADYVKFQTFAAERLVTQTAAKAGYQIVNTGNDDTQLEMLQKLQLSTDDHYAVIEHCAARGIGFMSSGFDIESVDFLVALGVTFLKIPSGEITNLPYLQHVGQKGIPVILSTGMASLDEVGEAIALIEGAGLERAKLTVLHCTTEYPTAMVDVNLRAMLTLRDNLQVCVGYSDHTRGMEVAIAAVAMGASVIEKHFTLDSTLPGPDHRASIEPAELNAMVKAIRNVELALGDGAKSARPAEEKNKAVVRKSLVASRKITAGELFCASNLSVKRPGTGISPMRWNDVVGQPAPRDFAPDELIEI